MYTAGPSYRSANRASCFSPSIVRTIEIRYLSVVSATEYYFVSGAGDMESKMIVVVNVGKSRFLSFET